MMEGWKNSEIGKIPEEWNTLRFGDVFGIVKSYSFSRNKLTFEPTDNEIHNVHYGDIHSKFSKFYLDFDVTQVPYIIDEFLNQTHIQFLRDGDIVIADVSEDLIDIGKCVEIKNIRNRKVLGGLHTIVARAKEGFIHLGYGAFIFKHPEVTKELRAVATGMSVYGVSKGNLSKVYLPIPPLPEQRKITYVLSTVQKAIEQQDKLIRAATELKKALMQKLFTEGTKGEKQKETEIGRVPESWEVVELGTCLTLSQYGLSAKGSETGEIPILRMTNQENGYIHDNNLQFVNISEKEKSKFRVNIGDVIFNRTNSFELVGKTSLFKLEGEFVFASYLIRLVTNRKKLLPEYLNCYLNSDKTQSHLKSIATRGVSQSNISATRLAGFFIPLPSLDEQKEICRTIELLDQKRSFHVSKKHRLTALFKTLLHELMTGQRRVHEVEFEALGKEQK